MGSFAINVGVGSVEHVTFCLVRAFVNSFSNINSFFI